MKIKKGDKYKCIKDVLIGDTIVFQKGKIYEAEDKFIKNHNGSKYFDNTHINDYFEIYKTEEMKSPNIFVYIRGNKKRGDEIINYLLEIGGKNIHGLDGRDNEAIYYINSYGYIDVFTISDENYCYQWIVSHYTEVVLPELPKYELKPFEKVLGRISEYPVWTADLFSHYNPDGMVNPEDGSRDNLNYVCLCGIYEECIPYEGNEELLGTNKPKEK